MPGLAWTSLAEQLGLDGQRLLFAGSEQRDRVRAGAARAGYAAVEVDTAGVTDFREAQARIASALRLPETAGRNLDALADSLRELARYWPDADRVVLVWCAPDRLIAADTAGWFRLADVLEDATDELWHGGEPDDRLFETVLLVDGLDA